MAMCKNVMNYVDIVLQAAPVDCEIYQSLQIHDFSQ